MNLSSLSSLLAPPKPPVCVLWDIENAAVPSSVSGFVVTKRLREVLSVYGPLHSVTAIGNLEILRCYRPELLTELTLGGVKLVDALPLTRPNAKDVADKMLLNEMFLWALDHPAPSTMVIITADIDFATSISVLQLRGYKIILVHPKSVSSKMLQIADLSLPWNDILGPPSDTSSTSPQTLVPTPSESLHVQHSSAPPLIPPTTVLNKLFTPLTSPTIAMSPITASTPISPPATITDPPAAPLPEASKSSTATTTTVAPTSTIPVTTTAIAPLATPPAPTASTTSTAPTASGITTSISPTVSSPDVIIFPSASTSVQSAAPIKIISAPSITTSTHALSQPISKVTFAAPPLDPPGLLPTDCRPKDLLSVLVNLLEEGATSTLCSHLGGLMRQEFPNFRKGILRLLLPRAIASGWVREEEPGSDQWRVYFNSKQILKAWSQMKPPTISAAASSIVPTVPPSPSSVTLTPPASVNPKVSNMYTVLEDR